MLFFIALLVSDPSNGAKLFRERCALCHEEGGGQGPTLGGLAGRPAGRLGDFSYSEALKNSHIVWTQESLDRFLAAPQKMVPGTTMVVSVAEPKERIDLVAYLLTLAAPAEKSPDRPAAATKLGDWRDETAGTHHEVDVTHLPAPFATRSARRSPRVVVPPENTRPQVPKGMSVSRFATGLVHPRLLRTAPNGDIFVAESSADRVSVLRGSQRTTFAEGLSSPFGIAFYPVGKDPHWVYVANTNSVVRFAYENGDSKARGAAETVVAQLSASSGGHWTRDVIFSDDGKKMFVSIGSASNAAENMAKHSAKEIAAWQAARGLGASWGEEDHRAEVLQFDVDGKNEKTFATGIRNCVGMAMRQGELWCSVNERDGLGDDLVPDYLTHVKANAFYGWPWFYLGDHEDPRHTGERQDLRGKITKPDLLVQAHSASLQMTFYDGEMFPEFRGDIFAAFHGSWNRSARTGYKLIRVGMKDGKPRGGYEDFLTGFVIDEDRVWGRPVGVTVAGDGSILVSDDGNDTIWRISR